MRAAATLACVAWLLVGPARAEDRALIIGINEYQNYDGLSGALNDARLMSRLAEEVWGFQPEQIKMLLDREASEKGIVSSIEDWLIAGTAPGDRVLLTYSGHGYHTIDVDGDEADGRDETLSPTDAAVVKGVAKNQIADDKLGQLLERLKGRRVMVLIDSCHSGTVTRSFRPKQKPGSKSRALPVGIAPATINKTRFRTVRTQTSFVEGSADMAVWTAVSATEEAMEDARLPERERQGVFTGAFARGLLDRFADTNENGRITSAELFAYVRQEAKIYCEEKGCGSDGTSRMTPTLEAPSAFLAEDLLAWTTKAPRLVETPPQVVEPGPEQIPPQSDEQRPEAETPPKAEDSLQSAHPVVTDIIPPSNEAGIRVSLVPGTTLRLGDKMRIRVSSERSGFLIALDVREAGDVVQLFPSKCQRPNRQIAAGSTVTIPDGTYGCVFRATEAGRGKIVAIVTEDNVPLNDLLNRNRDLSVVASPVDYLSDIADRLLDVWTGDPENRSTRWSLAEVPYSVGE